jgi:hypothetical protein
LIFFFFHFQPQERPLRIKRSRKSNAPADEVEGEGEAEDDKIANNNNDIENEHTTNDDENANHPAAITPSAATPVQQEQLTSSFRVRTSSHGSAAGGANTYSHNRAESSAMDIDEKEPKVES